MRGQRALVTGAGSRVGKAIAIALGAEGMNVAVHYHRNQSGAQDTVRQIENAGARGVALCADLTSRDAARELVRQSIEELSGLDLLVASAANFEAQSLQSITDADWDRTLNLNLAAPFVLAQCAADELARHGGNIVFITCSSVVIPFRGYLPYVAAKAGLYQLMRTLALELAPRVRVNAVAPGFVLPPVDMPEQQVEKIRKQLPLQQLGSAAEVAQAVVFLARSQFITGEQILVDGGRALARLSDGG